MLNVKPKISDSSEDEYYDAAEEIPETQLSPFAALPIEVFLHICSFLEVKDIILILSKVCRRFYEILSDENVWKSWIAKRWNCKYPIAPIDNDHFDWRGACFDIEREWNLWKGKEDTLHYVNVDDVHISSVDAVVFVNSGSICISGSRDRSMAVWNLRRMNGRRPKFIQKNSCHEGWIWRLQYFTDTLYSCSWDNTVKSWSLEEGVLENKMTFRCSSSVLSMTALDGLIVSGDYAKTVYAFDPRAKPEPVFTYSAHQGAILTLGTNNADILSGSEDRSLIAWDIRSKKVRQKITLGKSCYPNSSYADGGNLYVGDNKGNLHIFNLNNGSANLVSRYDIGHAKAISAIRGGRGYLMTASLDTTVKISLPTHPPHVITLLKSNANDNNDAVGGLDYCNGILATGRTNSVEFYISKDKMDVVE